MADCNNTLDFIKELNRMCDNSKCDDSCPLLGIRCDRRHISEEHIQRVQRWSDEHLEIKSCPICGSDAEIVTKTEYGDALFVRCKKFGCIEMRTGFGSRQQAAEAWNRRIEK